MEIQLYLRKKEKDKAIKSDCNVSKVKLTLVISIYLVVTKFNGTHIDWLGFGTNSKVKQIDLSCLLSQNFLTLRSYFDSMLRLL